MSLCRIHGRSLCRTKERQLCRTKWRLLYRTQGRSFSELGEVTAKLRDGHSVNIGGCYSAELREATLPNLGDWRITRSLIVYGCVILNKNTSFKKPYREYNFLPYTCWRNLKDSYRRPIVSIHYLYFVYSVLLTWNNHNKIIWCPVNNNTCWIRIRKKRPL